jgi:hypothetical protein
MDAGTFAPQLLASTSVLYTVTIVRPDARKIDRKATPTFIVPP